MNCYYCDKIRETDPKYPGMSAEYDLGSRAPRCKMHWRFTCGQCGDPAHFMAVAFCTETQSFFCSKCAIESDLAEEHFWAWKYYFRYSSPWSGEWAPSLDRLEFERRHPLQQAKPLPEILSAISQEPYLVRYPIWHPGWRPEEEITDEDIQSNWNLNADRWAALYDEDGDLNRRYLSDPPMLELLGAVEGLEILDLGCGNGYLCRKLAKRGARMTGVDLSDRFLQIAQEQELEDNLGITYHLGSAAEMGYISDDHFDKVVSNYVLMDLRDLEGVLNEVYRVLKAEGTFVVVISHPSVGGVPGGWVKPAYDSPRLEDRFAYQVDEYFHPGPVLVKWGDFDPVLGFHRPLRDYWHAFVAAGFKIVGFEEPSITDQGRMELPISRVDQSMRIPYSCLFQLVKMIPN